MPSLSGIPSFLSAPTFPVVAFAIAIVTVCKSLPVAALVSRAMA